MIKPATPLLSSPSGRQPQPGKIHRNAVPGPVWGSYPQAPEPEYPVRPRHRPLKHPHRVAAAAMELAAAGPVSVDAARLSLARHGLSDEGCTIALACVAQRYACRLGLSPHPNQLTAASCLLNQQLVELPTGEGKTLAAALAAAVLALAGTPVHLLTANAYLAARDSKTHQDFFAAMGLGCAHVTDEMPPEQRRQAWQQAVCYSTAKTCAFEYLRDQASDGGQLPGAAAAATTQLRGLCAAIVDEADCLLIDEASVPLVLAEPVAEPMTDLDPTEALALAAQLTPGSDFDCHASERRVSLRPHAMQHLVDLSPDLTQRWLHPDYRREVISSALVAMHILQRDIHYIVRDEAVVLVDETTGRLAEGRVLPGLLHTMVCARESLPLPAQTNARTGLSYPRFFARYHHLCGLSGTLREARSELSRAYGLRVVRLAPHRPCRLHQLPSRLFSDQQTLFSAVVARATGLATCGRAVLIGTDNVRQAQELANAFRQSGHPVQLLDASTATTEAEQIRQAGGSGKITVSTQIAGRGTDIRIDNKARQAGGLHVLNLQANRSARIDRQMAGRAARHGEPGSAERWCLLHSQSNQHRALRPVSPRVARLCAITAGLPAGAYVYLRQQIWQWHDRSQRVRRLRADLRNARDLHFSILSRH